MRKSMTGGANTMIMLLALLAIVIVTVALQVFLPAEPLAAGIAAGVGIAYVGFILYYFLFPRPGAKKLTFIQGYLPGAVLRYVAMIGLFCAVVFWLKMHTVGVLLGAFVGMMVSTFLSLNTIRHKGENSSERK
jgi:hypothetical protein